MLRIAVVGGGIYGYFTAYHLVKYGFHPYIYTNQPFHETVSSYSPAGWIDYNDKQNKTNTLSTLKYLRIGKVPAWWFFVWVYFQMNTKIRKKRDYICRKGLTYLSNNYKKCKSSRLLYTKQIYNDILNTIRNKSTFLNYQTIDIDVIRDQYDYVFYCPGSTYAHRYLKPVYGHIIENEYSEDKPKCFHKTKDGVFISNQLEKIRISYGVGLNTKKLPKKSIYKKKPRLFARPCSIDGIPFVDRIHQNVYLCTGGSFLGWNMAPQFTKWFVDYVIYKKKPIELDITTNRFKNYKMISICSIFFIILFIVIIFFMVIFYFEHLKYRLCNNKELK